MVMDELYYGQSCPCCAPASNFSNQDPSTPMVSMDIVQAFMQRVYNGMQPDTVDRSLWQAVMQVISQGIVDGLTQSSATTHSEAFLSELKHSAQVFSAFKVHTMAQNMRSLMLTSGGQLKPFHQWADEVAPIANHHVRAWLRTEYDTAVIRAHNAADWQEFQRNEDIFPNLRWMPTTSPQPESTHQDFWRRRLTLPINDEFWKQHHPGDRWNCKCSLEATDEPPTWDVKAEIMPNAPTPQRGLENNPGTDAHVFSDKHPYFPSSCDKCSFYKPGIKNRVLSVFHNRRKDCYNCPYINKCLEDELIRQSIRKRRNEVSAEIRAKGVPNMENPSFPHVVVMPNKSVREWLNQPYKYFDEKCKMLYHMPDIFKEARYLGPALPHGNKHAVLYSHLFEITVRGDLSWLVVHEMEWGEFKLHSISDNSNILQSLI